WAAVPPFAYRPEPFHPNLQSRVVHRVPSRIARGTLAVRLARHDEQLRGVPLDKGKKLPETHPHVLVAVDHHDPLALRLIQPRLEIRHRFLYHLYPSPYLRHANPFKTVLYRFRVTFLQLIDQYPLVSRQLFDQLMGEAPFTIPA